MPDYFPGVLGLVPQLYFIWRWRGVWRWLAAAPLLSIAVLAILTPALVYLQFGTPRDWFLFLQIVFYVSPLWLGLVGLTRLIIRWATVF